MDTARFGMAVVSGMLVGYFGDGAARGLAALMFAGALGAVSPDRPRPAPIRVETRA